eukprot:162120_1
MWAVLIRGLPLGVTPAALQHCIEEALDEHPAFPQQPTICDDEAVLYLPSRDIQLQLTSKNVQVGCNVVQITHINTEKAQQWIAQRLPRQKSSNSSQDASIIKYSKQHKREQRKMHKRRDKANEEPQNTANTEHVPEKEGPSASEPLLFDDAQGMTKGGRASPPISIHWEDSPSPLASDGNAEDVVDDAPHDDKQSLFNQIPIFSSNHPNRIIWYQYLIFVALQKPFYVTYPAEWCWDIEGQWLKFQEHYAINPREAEKVDSRFSIGDPESAESSHCMVGDLLNMRVIDNNTGKEYEFKRTHKLIGTLIAYGRIEFERYDAPKEREVFLYDRNTGYCDGVRERRNVSIGDRVVFEVWWYKDDNDTYHYDVTPHISSSSQYRIHFEMFAFNVSGASTSEIEDLSGAQKTPYAYTTHHRASNPYMNDAPSDVSMESVNTSLACYDPLIADDFKGERFDGLLIAFNKKDNTGHIVCFPFKDDPSKSLTLLFHTRFVTHKDTRLCVDMWLELSIGVNPSNYGQGIFGYVAMNIESSKQQPMALIRANPLMPTTAHAHQRERKYRGRIIVAPTGMDAKECGFIYNEFENTMTTLEVPQHEQTSDYPAGQYLRFNENKMKFMKNESDRDDYKIVAVDMMHVDKIAQNTLLSYYTSDHQSLRYKAAQYVFGAKLRLDMDRNIEFKCIELDHAEATYCSDIYLMIEHSETCLNAFLNTNGGGCVMFGVQTSGQVVGHKLLSKEKRQYIADTIHERGKHFMPSVPREYYSIEFKQVVDADGFIMFDAHVMILSVANLHAKGARSTHKYLTSQKQIYERRVTWSGTQKHSQLTRLNAYHYQEGYSKRKALNLEGQPQFTALRNIDSDEEEEQVAAVQANDEADEADEAEHANVSSAHRQYAQHMYYTTPSLNAKPIPPNTEHGRNELTKRVQLKLNEMMMIEEYMLDPRWQSILTMASSALYNAQKTTWMLMKNLETEKVREKMRQKQEEMQNRSAPMHGQYAVNNDSASVILVNNADDDVKECDAQTGILEEKYISLLSGKEPDLDAYGLPILPDKSKYKAVAMEYCQKMGWKRPIEAAQCVGTGYRATVSFGKPGNEKEAAGDGVRQKNAIYEAYIKLVRIVIPKICAIELMIKWVPGYKKQEKVSTATIAQSGQSIMKHPKSVLLEWAQKNSIAPPKTTFSEYADSSRNMRIWTAKVTFCGKTIESKGSKKKDAESKCFHELLKHVMNDNPER